MPKKRDKKKFKRQKLNLNNINIENVDQFTEDEVIEEKRAEKKIPEKSKQSAKSKMNLKKGRILEIKTNYRCLVELENDKILCTLGGRLKQINFETRNILAVGDLVNVDVSAEPRIEEVLARKNALVRYPETDFQAEIILAANIDQVLITNSVKEPELNLGLIDRYLCSAKIENIKPIILINKIDLLPELEQLKQKLHFYEELGYLILWTSAKTKSGISRLKDILRGKDSVFSGHSGTGKSSLINVLQPNLKLSIAKISASSHKGTHTTSSAKLLSWDFGGYLVDTPGIKTFGLKREDVELIPRIFPGFNELRKSCKFNNCTHSHETDCAIKRAVENQDLPAERYESYLRILDSLQKEKF